MWYHFSFASGGNPYIAMSASKKDSLIRKYRNRGVKVERIEKGFYLVHDENLKSLVALA